VKQNFLRAALVILGLAFLSSASEAQERTIRGTVVDSATAEPVANATVRVQDGDVGDLTGPDGSFVLEGAPGGEVTLVVQRIGFRQRTVAVGAGQSRVEIAVRRDYLRMEELVVTGRATETRRQNLAINVETISEEQINTNTPSAGIEDRLQGKVSGATISDNSGAPGGGMQVRIRGSSTIFADDSPLYVVDGTIISNEAVANGLNALTQSAGGTNASNQDDPVNRVVDLNPDDIESIEVLKGATAAAIYGSKAANGVVVIETKQGAEGGTRVNVTQRFGVFDLSNTIGSRTFDSVDEAVAAGYGFAAEEPYASRIENGVTFDNEEALADQNDLSYETSASVRGGVGAVNYYASGVWKKDEGIIPGTGFERQSARLNLSPDVGDDWSLDVSTNLVRTDAARGVANNDNSQISYYMVLSATPSFVDLRADDEGVFSPNPAVGNGSNPLQTAALVDVGSEVWRGLGSANLGFQAVDADRHQLRLTALAGADVSNKEDELFSPPAAFYEDADGLPGTAVQGQAEDLNFNLSLSAVWDWQPEFAEGVSSTFSTGAQFEHDELGVTRITSQNLNAGFPNVDVGAQTALFENRTKVEDFGVYLQEQILAVDERLSLQGSVRFDQSSANGDPDEMFIYPNANASFRFPDLGGVFDELKLRAAWGQSGNQPLFGQKFTSLAAGNNIEGIPGVIIGTQAGAEDIEPETTTEYEGGFDLTLLDGRVQLSATAYRQEIDDMILQRELAPSKGIQEQFFNGGRMENEGLEASIQGTPIAGTFTWNTSTTFSTNSSEVLSLPVPAFSPGPGFGVGGDPLVEEGKSLTQIISTEEGEEVQAGNTEPAFTMNFVNSFEWKGLTLHSVLDLRHDRDVINLTEFLYDAAQISPDWDPPGDEVRPATECGDDCSGLERIVGFLNGTQTQFVQDAGFLKVRELALSWDLPDSFVEAIGGPFESLGVTVSGRNLITVTDYRGLDPEVSNFGNQPVGRNIDVAPFPPSRSFWLTLDAQF
jgi:TonB-linked SusC/RagA family outer membrane protein